MTRLNISVSSPDETARLSAGLAKFCKAGDCILLRGDLGTGKTQFARGFIQALCSEIEVTSPTFTLVQTYQAANATIWHFDLYRLEKESDIQETGMDDALREGIILIEWPDIIAHILPKEALHIEIAYGQTDDERLISFASESIHWKPFFDSLGKYVSAA